jgi:hypothetical protein
MRPVGVSSCEFLDIWIERVEGGLVFFFSGLGVWLVGVFSLADGLEDAGGVPFCEFDLLEDFWLGGAPFVGEVEEGCGCVEGIGGLSGKAVRIKCGAELCIYVVSPRHFVRVHCPLCAIKCLLRKLLDVGLTRCIVHDRIVVWALWLCGLEALEQRLCEVEAVIVGGVEALSYDLVDGMIFACFMRKRGSFKT